MATALITGITGQDGSYLAELLLEEGVRVVGMVRPGGPGKTELIAHLLDRIALAEADLADIGSLERLLREHRPSEVYHLAAVSHVAASWADPVMTGEVTGLGTARLLEAIRRTDPSIRFLLAGSAEMFGRVRVTPQDEDTPFLPRSPYGAAKVYAHHTMANYREGKGLFACSAIMFNHESPRRGPEFVTRKITSAAARIKLGLERELRLGNVTARRDWSFAGDFVRAMRAMMRLDRPEDFVLGSGITHTVEDLCRLAFECVGLDWRAHVVQDPALFRPADTDVLVANPAKARRVLGWQPRVDFPALVAMMVEAEMRRVEGPKVDGRRS
jgi:GDPmannose 4,6-dehydratase